MLGSIHYFPLLAPPLERLPTHVLVLRLVDVRHPVLLRELSD